MLVVSCGGKKPPAAPPPAPPPPPPAPVVQAPPPPPPAPRPQPPPPPPPPPVIEPTEAALFDRTPLEALNNGVLTTNLSGSNNDLVFTAKQVGSEGVTVTYVDPGGASAPLSVVTNGKNITVNLGRRNNAISSTANDVMNAINSDPAASALVAAASKAGNDGTGVVTAMSQQGLDRPLSDVYFELDKADLSDQGRADLQKDADWLRKWGNTRITIEGHADSRGTNEYNLALGERRAAATRDYLVSLGIPATRISVVSKGEEQPFCTEEVEGCWAKNRRGHFIITGK